MAWRTPEQHGPLNQLSNAYVGSQRQKQQAPGLHGSAPGPLHISYGCNIYVFVGLLKMGVGMSLTLFHAGGTVFLLLD